MTDTNPLAPIEALADSWERYAAMTDESVKEGRSVATVRRTSATALRAALAEARQAVDALARWKSGALPVLDGLQEIGHALGLPLGEQITGPAALEAINALVAERDAAREALARAKKTAAALDRWGLT